MEGTIVWYNEAVCVRKIIVPNQEACYERTAIYFSWNRTGDHGVPAGEQLRHLAILENIFHIETDGGMLFDIMLHVGTLAAVFVVYHKDIWRMIVETSSR